ncbi:putative eka-like protein [Erysiphe necator]|uniref:Putative eka-like protein n=1 Tax=Uncinula necator TaxID=52586 RepID=A0A0B1NVQ1_UNCNE|nr:putative eka-like protein [Erysiphe necator]
MEITQDTQTPSTETSNPTPPIPHIPPTLNPLPLSRYLRHRQTLSYLTGLHLAEKFSNLLFLSSPGSGKEKNVEKNVAVATPKLPKPPQTSQNTWVTVARNGQKKVRVTQNNNTHTTPMSKIRLRVSTVEGASAAPTDNRLFLRLPQEHEWRKLSPAEIRKVILKKLSISPVLVGEIKPVNSGFALSPCSTEAREKILNAGNGLFLTGVKLEAATNWVTVLIPTVPAFLQKEQGVVEVSNSMLADEVERVCSVRPAHIKLYGRNKPEAPYRTWMAFFPNAEIDNSQASSVGNSTDGAIRL